MKSLHPDNRDHWIQERLLDVSTSGLAGHKSQCASKRKLRVSRTDFPIKLKPAFIIYS